MTTSIDSASSARVTRPRARSVLAGIQFEPVAVISWLLPGTGVAGRPIAVGVAVGTGVAVSAFGSAARVRAASVPAGTTVAGAGVQAASRARQIKKVITRFIAHLRILAAHSPEK